MQLFGTLGQKAEQVGNAVPWLQVGRRRVVGANTTTGGTWISITIVGTNSTGACGEVGPRARQGQAGEAADPGCRATVLQAKAVADAVYAAATGRPPVDPVPLLKGFGPVAEAAGAAGAAEDPAVGPVAGPDCVAGAGAGEAVVAAAAAGPVTPAAPLLAACRGVDGIGQEAGGQGACQASGELEFATAKAAAHSQEGEEAGAETGAAKRRRIADEGGQRDGRDSIRDSSCQAV